MLNVAGPRASKDPKIYKDVKFIIQGVLLLAIAEAPAGTSLLDLGKDERYRSSSTRGIMSFTENDEIRQIVDDLVEAMSLEDLVQFANMDESDVQVLQKALELYLSRRIGEADRDYEIPEIMEALWQRVKETHRIRRVK